MALSRDPWARRLLAVRRINTALRRIRQDLGDLLDRSTVQRVYPQVGHSWRAGILCPYATLRWFLLKVLGGNTALEDIATFAKKAFTDSACCQARARLPLAVCQAILRALIKAFIPPRLPTADGMGAEPFWSTVYHFPYPTFPSCRPTSANRGPRPPDAASPLPRYSPCFTRAPASIWRSWPRPCIHMRSRASRTSIPPCSREMSWSPIVLLLLRSSRAAQSTRRARVVSDPPAIDRRFRTESSACSIWGQKQEERTPYFRLGSAAWAVRPESSSGSSPRASPSG